ncbi:hypothetical protein [Pseudoclavibacter sp. 13-3]|uniref:hypothetical protein n=1 Tax=Pseudoclavibacter sp. 13-3 TaxID=2901228 RepID=UPI001E3B7067|nr:hypothetical protein [Pseudoclavibacter sp. 13-3]MCD7100591.1 hypothetical protein [Pseudoclavibacter sp. 13-3]
MNAPSAKNEPGRKIQAVSHGLTFTSLILVIVSLGLFIGGGFVLGNAPMKGDAGLWEHLLGLLMMTAGFFTALQVSTWFSND